MSKYLRTLAIQITGWVRAIGGYIVESLLSCWDAVRYRDGCVPIEVLVANATRRRRIERRLRGGLRQLQRALGERPSCEIAILVQQVITTTGSSRLAVAAVGRRNSPGQHDNRKRPNRSCTGAHATKA